MEKSHSFAGTVIAKHGKKTINDFPQPEKFFHDVTDCLRVLEEMPFTAIEELQKYESNRDSMVAMLRRIHKIFRAADINICEEIKRQEESPFDGLEDDLKDRE